ncbi:SAM-dependent methyltransferase [Corynebacterium sp. zg912]|uniref:SAM-dependent methyltransferase n=1 Tax=Corynebacterium wankanglinii TaxID=2735136 RepID=A0A7H0KC13_9CORY|nr:MULTISPECIES: SAM-dependent methyltransferase [Corynebacterium]MBA1837651.1 SAM-dependent methyltransferase [Corynebacterium wankanglinii]MCR5928893.1 SAM-dependent methyltransferase [Corynebacterium sp. zg912]QNP94829.1 SAM-dependent methyltransferase [Corynebacterium wankanglinii]
MLNDIVDVLADPADLTPLRGADDFTRLVSESGHSYDVAKQGYVTLAAGKGIGHEGDSLEMVNSRETFLSNGHFAPFVESVSDALADVVEGVAGDADPVILEAGAGTGYYLAHTLDLIQGARGVGLDVSVPAAKHLAKSHPRVGAVVADVWEQLPIRTGSIHALAVVFAPRNPAEFARVLVEGGEAVMLVADQGHLDELREPLGILGVEDGKIERLIAQSEGHLVPAAAPELIEYPMQLGRDAIAAQVGMSPSARHLDADVLQARLAELPEQMEVTARAQLIRMRKA